MKIASYAPGSAAEPLNSLLTALGFGLAGYVFAVYAVSVLMFSLGNAISGHTVWFALAFATILVASLSYRNGITPALSVCAGLLVAVLILLTIWISGSVYDISWDGMAYHQEAVIRLAKGWNPIETTLGDTIIHAMWIDHFPKFTWIFAANHYAAFGNVETGKCYSLILALAVLCLVYPLLRGYWQMDWRWALVISLLVLGNPVLINQMFTFYLDGALYATFFLACIAAVHIIVDRKLAWFVLFGISGVMLINTKLTGGPYFCLISATAALYLLINRGLRSAVQFSAMAAAFFLAAFLLFGYDTYVKNMLAHGHPFYPIYGRDAFDIMTAQSPVAFQHVGSLKKLFLSIFHVVSNNRDEPLHLRLPFLLQSREELHASVGQDTRLSGFGFWFSGIFVTAIAALVYLAASRSARFPKATGLLVVIALLVTVLVNPEAWWARYAPQLWLFPVAILALLRFVPTRPATLMSWFLAAIMLANSGVIFRGGILLNHRATSEVTAELVWLQSSAGPLSFHLGPFQSQRARLEYRHIPFANLADDQPLPCSDSRMFPWSHAKVSYCPPP